MQKHILPLLCAGVIASPIAAAESELYVTGGVSSFDLGSVTPSGGTIRGGWRWDEHFGAEIEGSFGLESDATDFLNSNINIEGQVGAFLVGRLPINDKVSVFGRIGYARTEVEYDFSNNQYIRTADGIASGIGAEYSFTDRFGIRGDLTHTDGGGGIGVDAIDALSVSAVFKFGGPE